MTANGILAGLAVVLLGWMVAHLARATVAHLLVWRHRSPSSAAVFGRLTGWGVIFLFVGAGLTITFPSIRPVDVLGGVGVVSIAAGIAFQTVLGNMFAGIILVSRDKFRISDQIAVGDHAGSIVRIDITSTTLRTYDGRLVVVPNGVLHSKVVTVQTGFEHIRTTVAIDIDDAADLELARGVAVAAMRQLPSVLDEPAPDALLAEVGTTTVRLELRFWSGALQLEARAARHDVILAVLTALRTHGVKTGSDVLVIEPGPSARQLLEDCSHARSA
ncbi:small-conductance mechanosensitive channel MscS [Luteococcus sediminum]|uniref:mechanosensitive ion channel family protein n=1 Tax=Luteococcus sp. TaxID=1969402 RepID=UPI003736373D